MKKKNGARPLKGKGAEIAALYTSGQSMGLIAATMKVSRTAVLFTLQKQGVPLRTKKEAAATRYRRDGYSVPHCPACGQTLPKDQR